MGLAGGDADYWVDGFDIDGASAGNICRSGHCDSRSSTFGNCRWFIKVNICRYSRYYSAGVIRVFAVCMPIEGGLSKATDVDRDQLA